jgi:hypothetical protein
MADSNRTGQRLLDSIRKAKAGEDEAAAAASAPTELPADPTPPTRKTTARRPAARKAAARKATAKQATAKPAPTPGTAPEQADREAERGTARGATTAAPYPMFATQRPQPSAYPGDPTADDPFRSPGRVWPD